MARRLPRHRRLLPRPFGIGRSCEHESEISEAFGYMQAAGGFRILIANFLRRRSMEQHMEEVVPGLLAIARRGYWERLWVVQEAALGTGPVRLQCGHHVCDFGGFKEAQARALMRANVARDIQEGFQWGRRFALTFHEFRCSAFYDHGLHKETAQLLQHGIAYLMRYIFPDTEDELHCSFHERPYSHRLLHVLLRTSGYFQCRDERDRLYAILGVVGGVKKGRREMANIVKFMSSRPTHAAIGFGMDTWLKSKYGDSMRWILLRCVLGGLVGCWGVFFDSTARYWTVNRPEYVLTSHDEVTRALEPIRGSQQHVGVFFCALATYIAKETKRLAFLDAAACGKCPGAPSWVPDWRSKVEDETYKFAIAKRDDLAPESFRFLDVGKTLKLLALELGRVSEVWKMGPQVLHSTTWQYASDKMFVLPAEVKALVRETLSRALIDTTTAWSDIRNVFGLGLVLELFLKPVLDRGKGLLENYGTTVLHYTRSGVEKIAFVKAGEAKQGDQIVFVPGCYYQLVLRDASESEWPLTLEACWIGYHLRDRTGRKEETGVLES